MSGMSCLNSRCAQVMDNAAYPRKQLHACHSLHFEWHQACAELSTPKKPFQSTVSAELSFGCLVTRQCMTFHALHDRSCKVIIQPGARNIRARSPAFKMLGSTEHHPTGKLKAFTDPCCFCKGSAPITVVSRQPAAVHCGSQGY